MLIDLSSTNGCFVNGRRVREHRLRDGDLIAVGHHQMRFTGPSAKSHDARAQRRPRRRRYDARRGAPRRGRSEQLALTQLRRAPAAAPARCRSPAGLGSQRAVLDAEQDRLGVVPVDVDLGVVDAPRDAVLVVDGDAAHGELAVRRASCPSDSSESRRRARRTARYPRAARRCASRARRSRRIRRSATRRRAHRSSASRRGSRRRGSAPASRARSRARGRR